VTRTRRNQSTALGCLECCGNSTLLLPAPKMARPSRCCEVRSSCELYNCSKGSIGNGNALRRRGPRSSGALAKQILPAAARGAATGINAPRYGHDGGRCIHVFDECDAIGRERKLKSLIHPILQNDGRGIGPTPVVTGPSHVHHTPHGSRDTRAQIRESSNKLCGRRRDDGRH